MAPFLWRLPAILLLLAGTGCQEGNGAPPGERAPGPGTADGTSATSPDGTPWSALDGPLADSRTGRPSAATMVRPGLEVLLADSLHLVEGRRVGLVTNHTGFDGEGVSSIDRLHAHPQVELVALFSPEHGIRGTAEAGELVDHTRDEATGLPVHSLYGETRKPTPAMLEGVEVLLFDILDIGTRYYTYIYTLALAMEAAGEAGIPFVVLDRPNVIGGVQVQGNVLDPAFASFVGLHPLPMRHGMTPGELARLYRDAFGIRAELHVVPLEGWGRGMGYEETGLPWRPPSPNMPSEESALHYPGTCLFEGTNLSVGRGTDRAFQQVGAPWLDGPELARRLEARWIPGVRFEAVRFTPDNPGDGKFPGQEVEGVRLHVTDPSRYDPTEAGVALLVEAHRMSGERWGWNASHFDRLAGTDALRLGIEAGLDVEALREGWREEVSQFLPLREAALLYR
jgi:uncharacterized protein YbbC (DUF1343 family)